MTLSSMTAFSRSSDESQQGVLIWELRSVNHRFLEVSIRLPETLRYLEQEVRAVIQKSFKRGKIEVALQYKPGDEAADAIVLNEPLLKRLADVEQQMAARFSGVTTSLVEMLRWPGVLTKSQSYIEVVGEKALSSLEEAVLTLKETRCREGQSLYECLTEHAKAILQEVESVAERMPEVLANERQKVLDRLETLVLTVEQDRLEQEMVWLAQKADIAEECHRIKTHVSEVERVLNEGGVVGRRLDFLMQELNREANTIASKSIDVKTTQSAVEMKVLIEQMREQVQNVE